MNKILIVLALILGIGVAIVVSKKTGDTDQSASPSSSAASPQYSSASTLSASTPVKLEGQGHQIEGTLNAIETHQFLMKDEGRAIGTYKGDAFLTMMPLKTAEELRDKYGNFFNCKDAGAQDAIRSMQASILVGHTPESQKTISDAMALVRKGKVPVISFQGGKLQVTKQEYGGMKVNDSTGISIYYADDFRIITENFSTSK
ncbi:MAG: hypothetical protein H6R18_1842 [Proteobacteria bacterium]|nr:hypothetical protein [Pseudomonadota bacterium]